MTKIWKLFIALCLVLTVYSQQCPYSCSVCSNQTSCTTCVSAILVYQTFCLPYPLSCTQGTLGSDNLPNCTSCLFGAYLTEGQCKLCNSSCASCQNLHNCTMCKGGYQLQTINGSGVCGPLLNCSIPNCESCSNSSYCDRCINNLYYYFFQECIPCKFPCGRCSVNIQAKWTNISTFWTALMVQFMTLTANTIPPQSLPSFLQNLDFSSMDYLTKFGWTQAYYAYLTIKYFLPTITDQQLITQAVQLYLAIQNLTTVQQYAAVIAKLSELSGRVLTLQILKQKLIQISNEIVQCAYCQYGLLTDSNTRGCKMNGLINCKVYSGSSCSKCIQGYLLENQDCVNRCNPSCRTCSGSSSTCTSCKAPKVLIQSTCVLCEEPCKTCSLTNTSICTECKPPYSSIPNNSGVCFRCAQDSCLTCSSTNTSICTACRYGSSLVAGILCAPCTSNCLICFLSPIPQLPSVCLLCSVGFRLQYATGRCVSCNRPGCLVCGDDRCDRCESGYFLNHINYTCEKCFQGCVHCSAGSQDCYLLADGITIFGGQLVNCMFGCRVCDITNPSTCYSCLEGFILDSGVCKSCSSNCLICTSPSVCTTCTSNSHLSVGKCLACQGQCLTCQSSNLTSCLSCKAGTTLVGIQCLKICPQGCTQCDPNNYTICSKCSQGFALTSRSSCVKCLAGCTGSCDSNNITICLSCANGFELINGQCVICPMGCTACLNQQCSSCDTGFQLSTTNGDTKCLLKCRAPCQTCYGDLCYTCETGYILQNGACKADLSCNPNCPFCPAGTYVDNGNCTICITPHCSACLSDTCSSCFDGYFINTISRTCVACPSQCKTCTNTETCGTCSPGFVKQILQMSSGTQDALYSDKCIPCDPNCLTCTLQPTVCSSCAEGLRLFSSRCAGLFTVVYAYSINYDYTTFLQSGVSQQFIEAISALIGVNPLDNYITYIREGSTEFGGTISATDQNHATNIQSGLTTSVPGFSILSVTSQIYYGDAPAEKKPQQKQNLNIALIVGVTVGGVVLISIIIIIICVCKKSGDPQIKDQFKHSKLHDMGSEQKFDDSRQEVKINGRR